MWGEKKKEAGFGAQPRRILNCGFVPSRPLCTALGVQTATWRCKRGHAKKHVTSTANATPRNDKPPVETAAENFFVATSKMPSTFALHGAKTTVVPTAAAPDNLELPVSDPVGTAAVNVLVATLNTPTTFALYGAKTTVGPTAAAAANLAPIVRDPVATAAENLFVAVSKVPTTFASKGTNTTLSESAGSRTVEASSTANAVKCNVPWRILCCGGLKYVL